ncbi:hypothetical protein ERN12_02735 [Rhodobacteraceae bacterium]|nr:hypothetical protein ERN12_02735 [Paracoccaceae bacterium]
MLAFVFDPVFRNVGERIHNLMRAALVDRFVQRSDVKLCLQRFSLRQASTFRVGQPMLEAENRLGVASADKVFKWSSALRIVSFVFGFPRGFVQSQPV